MVLLAAYFSWTYYGMVSSQVCPFDIGNLQQYILTWHPWQAVRTSHSLVVVCNLTVRFSAHLPASASVIICEVPSIKMMAPCSSLAAFCPKQEVFSGDTWTIEISCKKKKPLPLRVIFWLLTNAKSKSIYLP